MQNNNESSEIEIYYASALPVQSVKFYLQDSGPDLAESLVL